MLGRSFCSVTIKIQDSLKNMQVLENELSANREIPENEFSASGEMLENQLSKSQE